MIIISLATASDRREGQRPRACEPREQGWSQNEIAAVLAVISGAVCQGMRCAHDGNVEVLFAKLPVERQGF